MTLNEIKSKISKRKYYVVPEQLRPDYILVLWGDWETLNLSLIHKKYDVSIWTIAKYNGRWWFSSNEFAHAISDHILRMIERCSEVGVINLLPLSENHFADFISVKDSLSTNAETLKFTEGLI